LFRLLPAVSTRRRKESGCIRRRFAWRRRDFARPASQAQDTAPAGTTNPPTAAAGTRPRRTFSWLCKHRKRMQLYKGALFACTPDKICNKMRRVRSVLERGAERCEAEWENYRFNTRLEWRERVQEQKQRDFWVVWLMFRNNNHTGSVIGA